jgi:hypothetical protein
MQAIAHICAAARICANACASIRSEHCDAAMTYLGVVFFFKIPPIY